MERAPKKTQSKHFSWKSIAKDENPESVLTKYFRDLYSISEEQEELTQSERRHWVELWKNMRMDCAGGMLISPKKLEHVLKKLKNGKRSPDQTTADVLKALPPECLEKLARSLSLIDVLGHGFPGRLAVFVDGDGSESGGCNVLDQVQTYCWTVCDAKSLRLRLAQVTPSTEIRECADCVCAEDTCRCWFVFAVESGGTVSRVAASGREESVRPWSGLQGNESARCEFVLDGLDCGNLEWKLQEGILGNGDVEQSSDEPRIASRSSGISSHLPDDHGIGASRFDKELDFTETGLETGRLYAGCDLLCGRCGVECCFGVCCRNNGVRSDRKTERGWTDGWRTENTLDEFPGDDGQKHHGGRIGCGVGKSWSLWDRWCVWTGMQDMRSHTEQLKPTNVVQNGNLLNSPWLPRLLRLNIVKTTMWQAFFWSSSVWTTVKAQRDKIASWSARMVANVVGVKRPPGMELGQWWRLWHRTGHRCIEKCNMNVLLAI